MSTPHSPTANATASDATGDKSTSDMSEYANVTAEEQEAARAYLHHLLGDTDTAPPLDECGPYAEVLDTAAGLVETVPDEHAVDAVNSFPELEKLRAGSDNGEADADAPEDAGPDADAEVYDSSLTQAQLLLAIADHEGAELWRTSQNEMYATYTVDGTRQTSALRSGGFRQWLRWHFHKIKSKPPGSQALQDAIDTLAATAQFEGATREAALRITGSDEQIFMDLGGPSWQAVEVTESGWTTKAPENAYFRRVKSMKPLPRPEDAGTEALNKLQKHIRVETDADFALLLAWLVQALRPSGPYPLLVLQGEQGSGKTTTAEMIRALIDPSHVPTRAAPRKEEDLIVYAENAWVLSLDNMSGIRPWLSDALCRLATGGGFGTRKLYAGREEEIFYAQRPVILNGIDDVTGRPDLADRAVVITLNTIPEAERKTAKDVWSAFNADRPAIIGGLLSACATAIRRMGTVQFDTLPRMADFAVWAAAAEQAFPTPPNTFREAYAGNRERTTRAAAERDPVAMAVLDMLNDRNQWTGKMSQLPGVLLKYVPDSEHPPDALSTWQALQSHMKRIMPILRDLGVTREDDSRARVHAFTLRMGDNTEATSEGTEDADNEPMPF